MKFTKMHGIGNDYVYVNCFEEEVKNPEEISKFISNRRFGIGSDGLILILPSNKADFKMRMFNADGSEGKMCGNGARCIGKYVYEYGLTNKTEFTLETMIGIKHIKLFLENNKVKSIEVDMGKARLRPKDIPVISELDNVILQPIVVNNIEYQITCVSMDNPHAVIFTDKIDELDLEKIGPCFENHPIFPERVNTEFVEVINFNTLKMRVWERGSGETLACGTGACAVAVAACLNGICKQGEQTTIILRGGNLEVTYHADGTVKMIGPATIVFDGDISL